MSDRIESLTEADPKYKNGPQKKGSPVLDFQKNQASDLKKNRSKKQVDYLYIVWKRLSKRGSHIYISEAEGKLSKGDGQLKLSSTYYNCLLPNEVVKLSKKIHHRSYVMSFRIRIKRIIKSKHKALHPMYTVHLLVFTDRLH